jgi:hypothetical protein
MIEICATCLFWVFERKVEEKGQIGVCRRNEPTFSLSWHCCNEYESGVAATKEQRGKPRYELEKASREIGNDLKEIETHKQPAAA